MKKLPDGPEVWVPIKEFEDTYEVSTMGCVRRKGRYLKGGGYKPPAIRKAQKFIFKGNTTEYRMLGLYQNGKKKNFLVHHLMRDHFLGPRTKGDRQSCCRHLNGDGTDNRLSNLKLGTVKENIEDSRRHGTMCRGEKSPRAQLTEKQIWYILESPLSQRDLAKEMGIKRDNIKEIRGGKSWNHIFREFKIKVSRGLVPKRTCTSGPKKYNNLTVELVWDILASESTAKDIALSIGMNVKYIQRLRRGVTWKHVYEEFHAERDGSLFSCPICAENSSAIIIGKCKVCDGGGTVTANLAERLNWQVRCSTMNCTN